MRLKPVTPDLDAYLVADQVVDHAHPLVRRTAAELRAAAGLGEVAYARAAFTYVRDEVAHSADAGHTRVTCRASEVLAIGTGVCHAKAHALVALLRCAGIPAGFCYQRLDVLHGLLAVRLPPRPDAAPRWARLDPRGNRPGVDAQFSLEREQLAWPVRDFLGECDYPVLYADPHPLVVRALTTAGDLDELWELLHIAL